VLRRPHYIPTDNISHIYHDKAFDTAKQILYLLNRRLHLFNEPRKLCDRGSALSLFAQSVTVWQANITFLFRFCSDPNYYCYSSTYRTNKWMQSSALVIKGNIVAIFSSVLSMIQQHAATWLAEHTVASSLMMSSRRLNIVNIFIYLIEIKESSCSTVK